MKKKLLGVTAAVAGVGLTLAMTAAPAWADPTGAPTYRPLAGMGSDTTFEVMNDLSDVVQVGGQKVIGSYNPEPAGQVVSTKDEATNPNCNTAGGSGGVPRANGSSAGRDALNAATTVGSATFGCLDFARTSSGSVVAGQTFVPMASDGLTYAYPFNGAIGPQSTLADLKLVYTCDPAVAGLFVPLIPQSGSGTRNSWATLMGISNTTLPSCVKDVVPGGLAVQEHDGRRFNAANQVMPFSVAQYIAQEFGAAPDRRGTAQLGQLDGVNPLIQNPAQANLRVVGNILPTAVANDAASLGNDVFINNGSGTSELCVDGKATLARFGYINSVCP
jgi:hypothetical protein